MGHIQHIHVWNQLSNMQEPATGVFFLNKHWESFLPSLVPHLCDLFLVASADVCSGMCSKDEMSFTHAPCC